MDFKAEIIRASQRKLASGDNQYEIVLRTENPNVLDLGKLPPDTVFDVSVTLYDNIEKGKAKENQGYEQI